jgi:short-subunit dehydrogenase
MPRGLALNGRHILLTGATGGIGHAIARSLAERGATLTLTGRRTDVLEPLAAELGATAIAADLANAADVDRLIASSLDVDVLVANAGLSASGAALDYSAASFDTAIAVNLRAPMVLARALAAQMKERGAGQIVFIGSVGGKVSSAGGALYSATKFGLRGFSLGFREDLHGTGVGVSLVAPGFVRDAGMFADAGTPTPPGVRTSSPEQVAKAVVRAIEKDIAEIVVAPMEMRVSTFLGTLAPGLAARVQRMAGGDEVARKLGEVHRSKL